MRGSRRRRTATNRKGKFDPNDELNVKHTRVGVWDLYEEIDPKLRRVPGSSRFRDYLEMIDNIPYVWTMIKDIMSIRSCWFLMGFYLFIEFTAALIPAVSVW